MAKDFFDDLKHVRTSPGGIIRAFRTNFKITLKELSEATGLAESNLSLIENDKVEVGVKRASLIATALGVDPSSILFPFGYKSPYQKKIEEVKKMAIRIFGAKRKQLKAALAR